MKNRLQTTTFQGAYHFPTLAYEQTPYPISGEGSLDIQDDGITFRGFAVGGFDGQGCVLIVLSVAFSLLVLYVCGLLGVDYETQWGRDFGFYGFILVNGCNGLLAYWLMQKQKSAKRPYCKLHPWRDIREIQSHACTLKPNAAAPAGGSRFTASAGRRELAAGGGNFQLGLSGNTMYEEEIITVAVGPFYARKLVHFVLQPQGQRDALMAHLKGLLLS